MPRTVTVFADEGHVITPADKVIQGKQGVTMLASSSQWDGGTCTAQCGGICKKEGMVVQSIGKVVYVNEELDPSRWKSRTERKGFNLYQRFEEWRISDITADCSREGTMSQVGVCLQISSTEAIVPTRTH